VAAGVVHIRRQFGAVCAAERRRRDGVLTISLTPNPASTTEPYLGVEMRSLKTLTYGKVSAG
jgi:hypothetical protein